MLYYLKNLIEVIVMPCGLYIAISGEDKILTFAINSETGKLTLQGETPVTGRPATMVMAPDQQFIYIGRKDAHAISIYRRNTDAGKLSHVSTAPVEFEPDYLATDRNGRFLFSTYFFIGKVAIHAIGSGGIIDPVPVQIIDTVRGVHSVQTDPSNRFVFFPHTAGKGPNIILQFKFDAATGRLTPNTPDRVRPDEGVGPRHCCFHPKLNVFYCSNESGSSVSAYHIDPTAGTLTALQTVSTLPDGYQQKNACADIQISPSGEFVYVSNRGHNSLAVFSVDKLTGRLTPTGHAPTEPEVRSFSLTPDGNFLYAAGLESGRLASYRVNREIGILTPLDTQFIGKESWGVLVTG
jgi:6-phosphogluconolactonase